MIQTLKIHENSLKMFHNNACFLNKNFEHIEYLLKSTNINYNIIARSETRIKNSEITKNIILKNYNFQYAPTESITISWKTVVGWCPQLLPGIVRQATKTDMLDCWSFTCCFS